jgi:hypothetical protein
MKKYLFRISQLAIAIAVLIMIQKCGTDTGVNANESYIGGTIYFATPTPAITGGYYAVSFYWADSSNPFSRTPARSDSLPINLTQGGVTSIYYKSTGFVSSNYYVGCTFLGLNKQVLGVLGTFGCDTNHLCDVSPDIHEIVVPFPNYAGNGAVDFKSWTQIVQKIH